MITYHLVTFGEDVQLTLTTAESTERASAIQELKKWAIAHNHRIARSADDSEATCMIQTMETVETTLGEAIDFFRAQAGGATV
jgi:hypothetical protein